MKESIFIFGLLLGLVSCGSPGVSTPAPTPQAIQVIYPVALQPWADKIASCAKGNPFSAVYFSQEPQQALDNIFSDEITLNLGEPSNNEDTDYLSQVGNEQVIIIVNANNPLSRLSSEKLSSIYTGETSQWENDNGENIQTWVLPPNDPVRIVFDQAIVVPHKLSSDAMLAPDPTAMLESIAGDTSSIGYLPQSILTSADPSLAKLVKIVQVDDALQTALTQPVIAITKSEPRGLERELIACLQSAAPGGSSKY